MYVPVVVFTIITVKEPYIKFVASVQKNSPLATLQQQKIL